MADTAQEPTSGTSSAGLPGDPTCSSEVELERFVAGAPNRPGAAEAVLTGSGVSVWVVIAYAQTVDALRALGHAVTSCRGLGTDRWPDHRHLLLASQRGWVFLTHDHGFVEQVAAWDEGSRAWGVEPQHPGVLIVPDVSRWPPQRAAREVDAFITQHDDLANACHRARLDGSWRREVVP